MKRYPSRVLLAILMVYLSSACVPAMEVDGPTRVSSGVMQLVHVPSGTFIMGAEGYFDEKPTHIVNLASFWIDMTEVTNSMFAKFLNERGNQMEGGVSWLDARDDGVRIHQVGGEWTVDREYEDRPVVEVTWYGAQAYCFWAGRRLPTEAEWEKAARGTSANLFPWGNDLPTADLLNFDKILGDTTAVGSYPTGASPYGVLDMAGNVWEWTADWYDRSYYSNSPLANPPGPETGAFRVLRGGAWNYRDTYARTVHRNPGAPSISHDFVGFRCAMDGPERVPKFKNKKYM